MELWSGSEARHDLFSEGGLESRRARIAAAGLPPELRPPLETIATLLGNPRLVEPSRIAGACREVACWASGRGKLETALLFAQAGALADPENALAAVLVGRLARIRAEYDRAESWFDHALMLARKSKDWQAKAEALAGLGNLYMRKGNYPKAREYHLRCLRAARRHTLREMEGAALHNLFVVAMDCDLWSEADEYAAAALAAYPAGSASLIRLAQDVAFRWVSRGRWRSALAVMEELLPHVKSIAVKVILLAHIAGATAGVRDYDAFEGAWAQTWAHLGDPGAEHGAARALIGLSHAAASIDEWGRAELAADRALRLTTLREEETARIEAERLLATIRERTYPQEAGGSRNEYKVEHLVDRFTTALRESRTVV